MTLEWKKSDDWIVIRRAVSRRVVTVLFAHAEPSTGELAALRRISDEIGRVPIAEIKQRVGATGSLALGEFGGIEAGLISRAARREGFTVREESKSRTEFIPINRT